MQMITNLWKVFPISSHCSTYQFCMLQNVSKWSLLSLLQWSLV